MLEVILAKNYFTVDVPFDTILQSGFPVEWTSTNLDGPVSGLGAHIGFDKNLSARFRNVGAPKYTFKTN
jgi:hypothetical protein